MLVNKIIFIQNKLFRIKIECNNINKKLSIIRNKIHSLNYEYKCSFYKNIYLSKFYDISQISDYRLDIQLKIYELGLVINKYKNRINVLNKACIKYNNNLVYYNILLNKINL